MLGWPEVASKSPLDDKARRFGEDEGLRMPLIGLEAGEGTERGEDL
jgi:hypothetical protein